MRPAVLLVLCFLNISGLLVFLTGFFPVDVVTSNDDFSNNAAGVQHGRIANKVVIMVIDALRRDFVYGPHGGMPFLSENADVTLVTRTSNPTVTLPRLKSIVTGTIPGYIDVLMNFASTHLRTDNIISRWQASNRQLHFFGDDTWLKMFPTQFARSDGVTSFFARDFTEVDNNVTRHINSEMNSSLWDVLILHYLGLDHIGHIHGPRSALVRPKLLEMDNIVRTIYKSLEKDDILLVLGDHGMATQGGHGGSSPDEVLTPAVFLSPGIFTTRKRDAFEEVPQIDITTILAFLTGMSPPCQSIGILPESLLFSLPDIPATWLASIVQQLKQLSGRNDEFIDALRGSWELDHAVLREVQSRLLSHSAEYNMSFVYLGLIMLAICVISTLVILLDELTSVASIPLPLFSLLHLISMFSTALVEEEHRVVYFLVQSTLLCVVMYGDQTMNTYSFSVGKLNCNSTVAVGVLFMATVRFLHSYHATGVNFVEEETDISGELLVRPYLLAGVFLACSFLAAEIVCRFSVYSTLVAFVFSASAYEHKAVEAGDWPSSGFCSDSALLARIAFGATLVSFIITVLRRGRLVTAGATHLLLATIVICRDMQAIPLLLLIIVAGETVAGQLTKIFSPVAASSYILLLVRLSFFALDNSNTLATVDAAAAYTGLRDYNAVLGGILLFVSVFAAPISTGIRLLDDRRRRRRDAALVAQLLFLHQSVILFAFLVCATVQRYHLFIWSVYAPKLLYEAVWTVIVVVLALLFSLVK